MREVAVVLTHQGWGEGTEVWGVFTDMAAAVAAVKADGMYAYSENGVTKLRGHGRNGVGPFGTIEIFEVKPTTPVSDADYIRLGRILERFIKQDGVIYWGVGEDNRPREDGQEGGMTIDMSVTISEAEAALLDRVGEPW